MITPYLMLVLAGVALFMLALAVVWIRNFVDDIRAARRQAAPAPAPAKAKPSTGSATHDARQAV